MGERGREAGKAGKATDGVRNYSARDDDDYAQDGTKEEGAGGRKWTRDDFDIGKALGRGKFGNVYLGWEKRSSSTVALKVLFKSHLSSGTASLLLKREVEIQSRLAHNCVLKLFGYFHDDAHVYLILEEASGGEVYKLMSEAPGGRLPPAQASRYVLDVASALVY